MKAYRPLPLLAACLAAALCALTSARRGWGGEPSLPDPEAARLVRDLGSADYKAREAATRRLLECETPSPALRAAVKSGDAEVARRAHHIIDEISRREKDIAFGKLAEFARRGEIDRFAELLVRRPKWDDEEACWQALAEINGKLFDLESKEHRRTSFGSRPQQGLGERGNSVKRRRVTARRAAIDLGHMDVRAEYIDVKNTSFSHLVSTRSTQAHSVNFCVLVGGGTIEVERMGSSVVVCDGDVECDSACNCLIIARGDVRFSESVGDCRVITAGSVRFAPGTKRGKVEIKEHEPNPPGFVRWFDPARVGVTVETAAGGVRVKAAAKSFAAAGLRAGDLLAAIDGEAVKSPDEFRLLLRAKLADGGRMALTVRRAGRDLTIPVRCKD